MVIKYGKNPYGGHCTQPPHHRLKLSFKISLTTHSTSPDVTPLQ